MEIFWSTIADYNTLTWPFQIGWVVAAVVLTLLLRFRPTPAVRAAMKVYMALVNFWIAGVYYMICCEPRPYHDMSALFWGIMGCVWVYDLAVKHASLERRGGHTFFAVLLLLMPLAYPLCSLALGRSFPMMTSPVMPCSVAVFTVGLMLAFSERVNLILAMLLCHWALIGLPNVRFFGIPEDYLLACSVVPALYIFLKEYVDSASAARSSKPSPRVLNALLVLLGVIVTALFVFTLTIHLGLFGAEGGRGDSCGAACRADVEASSESGSAGLGREHILIYESDVAEGDDARRVLTIRCREHSGDGTFRLEMPPLSPEIRRPLVYEGRRFTQRGMPGDNDATLWQMIDGDGRGSFDFLRESDSVLYLLDGGFSPAGGRCRFVLKADVGL